MKKKKKMFTSLGYLSILWGQVTTYNHIRAASQLYPGNIGLFIFQKKVKEKGEDETRMHQYVRGSVDMYQT